MTATNGPAGRRLASTTGAAVGALAALGLLAGCAGQTAGVATAGPDTRISSPAVLTSATGSVVRAAPSGPRSAGGGGAATSSPISLPSPSLVTVTAAPVTTTVVRPPETVTAPPPPPTLSARYPGDLGLAQPISQPACDGSGIVVLHSATTPGAYAADVQAALDANPGSRYLRTDLTCPSLTAATSDGNPIYAVYLPAGHTTGAVCSVVAGAPDGAYGRWLSYGDSPDHTIDC